MRVWLVTVGEPLPLGGADDRLIRTGHLANFLATRGHDVVWWSSTFDHFRKRHHFERGRDVRLDSGVTLKLLHAPPYASNVSLGRIRHQQLTAREFARRAAEDAVPDVLLCSFPTIELSAAAVRYARSHGCPIALDVRDLWPDIFASGLPRALRGIAAPAIWAYDRVARSAMREARGLVAVSDGYLAWALRKARRQRSPELDAVLPIGFERPAIAEAARAAAQERLIARGVRFEGILAVFVGTFGRTYDLSTVAQAARMVERTLPGLQFVLAGDGESGPTWRDETRGLRNVVMPGWLGREELAVLCSAASVGLQSYAAGAPQGLPNKLFEYLGYGLAIVSSLEGENASLVDRHGCGLNYRAGDPESLRTALAELVSEPVRIARMRRAARALFEREFELSSIHQRFLAYLERLSAEKPDGARVGRDPTAETEASLAHSR